MATPAQNQLASAVDAAAITKSDSTTYSPPLRAIYVGTTGDVALVTVQGTTVTFSSVPTGVILPVYALKVMSTNTTASNMVGLY